jgi:hypothetical protein
VKTIKVSTQCSICVACRLAAEIFLIAFILSQLGTHVFQLLRCHDDSDSISYLVSKYAFNIGCQMQLVTCYIRSAEVSDYDYIISAVYQVSE